MESCEGGWLQVDSAHLMVKICSVDNYCHGLMLAFEALFPRSPVLGARHFTLDGLVLRPYLFFEYLMPMPACHLSEHC